ncbi:MAG TPA: SAM-dependent methyltransferase [Segeticoccus sp.]|uniref:SAM-dependent methyltransferase n=1 Tax=Segeticoccus sp. TaxID=2706531 RepID=UPI002D7F343C|nr:SAM-dependent methyltransferase [Segeticoccus sp.]HET8599049.1 SAM-dependent methyltransferase [Segeticoccus sp.]
MTGMTSVPWPRAWHDALYAGHGFYRSPAGPGGHFATSTQGIPGGGALFARAVATLADEHRFDTVVDLGCGRGELLGHLRPLLPHVRLLGVDVVPRPADLPEDVDWVQSPGGAELPDDLVGLPGGTLLLAHEWLDVVPCEIGEVDDHGLVRRVLVEPSSGEERLGDPLPGEDLQWCARHWPLEQAVPGDRVEVGRARDEAWERALKIVGRGIAVAVDYGHRRVERPRHGTLTGYRSGHQVRPVPDGSCDLTAHVAMDSLDHDDLLDQRKALHRLGVRAGTPAHALARRDPSAYLVQLAESSAAAALTAPGGLGDFLWAFRYLT